MGQSAGAARPTVHLGGSREKIILAADAVSRGQVAQHPFVLAIPPSVRDLSRAPVGSQVLWAYTHVPRNSNVDMTERYAPPNLPHRHPGDHGDQVDGGATAELLHQIAPAEIGRRPRGHVVSGHHPGRINLSPQTLQTVHHPARSHVRGP